MRGGRAKVLPMFDGLQYIIFVSHEGDFEGLVGLLFDGYGAIPLREEESSGLPPSQLPTARRVRLRRKAVWGALT